MPGSAIPLPCRLPHRPRRKYIPLGVPNEKSYSNPQRQAMLSDEYEIALVQYRTKFNSNLPATLVRGYVQLETPANSSLRTPVSASTSR